MKIPTEEKDITIEWLCDKMDVLANKIEEIKVIKPEIRGMMSNVFDIQIKYKKENQNEDLPRDIFLKVSNIETNIMKEMVLAAKIYEHELSTYEMLKKEGYQNIPKIYWSNLDKNTQEFCILMENLSPLKVNIKKNI